MRIGPRITQALARGLTVALCITWICALAVAAGAFIVFTLVEDALA